MKISVIGCGWYGTPLALSLKDLGHEVHGSTRSPDKREALQNLGLKISLLDYPQIPTDLMDADIIVINIPPFEEELNWLKSWPWQKTTWPIFISTTSGKNAREEEWIATHFSSWTILRFGGLLGGGRHPGKHLSGRKNLAGPMHPVNLLHQDDAVGITLAVINQQIKNEMIEVVSDEHHSRLEFYTDYAQRMNLPLPEFDLSDETKRPAISNKRAREIYDFKYPTMIGKSL